MCSLCVPHAWWAFFLSFSVFRTLLNCLNLLIAYNFHVCTHRWHAIKNWLNFFFGIACIIFAFLRRRSEKFLFLYLCIIVIVCVCVCRPCTSIWSCATIKNSFTEKYSAITKKIKQTYTPTMCQTPLPHHNEKVFFSADLYGICFSSLRSLPTLLFSVYISMCVCLSTYCMFGLHNY